MNICRASILANTYTHHMVRHWSYIVFIPKAERPLVALVARKLNFVQLVIRATDAY